MFEQGGHYSTTINMTRIMDNGTFAERNVYITQEHKPQSW